MDIDLDIAVSIRFASDAGIPAAEVINVLRDTCFAIRDTENDELEAILARFADDWPALAGDAMRYRFAAISFDHALNLRAAEQGSLLILGAAAGLAYWVADKTLGETVRQAWIESEDHARLKNFVKTRVFAKRDAITERLSRMIDRYGRRARIDRRAEPGAGIALEIVPDEALRVPSPSEVWDRRRRD